MSIYKGNLLIAGTGGVVTLPVGTIIPFAGSTAPSNFLICDGSALNRELYKELFDVISTLYGEGDGSTTFNLPNFIGRTFWGGSTSGEVKEAGLPNITGYIHMPQAEFSAGGAFVASQGGEGISHSGGGNNLVDFNASRSSAIYGNSDTVQPPAVQTIICIKYQ